MFLAVLRIDNEARILMEQFDKVKPINQFLNEGDQSLEETPAASVEEVRLIYSTTHSHFKFHISCNMLLNDKPVIMLKINPN